MNRIKPDGPNLDPTECPYCHEKINSLSGIQKDVQPGPGDIYICTHCGEPSKFDDQLQMVALEGSELLDVMSDQVVREAMLAIKSRKTDRRKAYMDQLGMMADEVVLWRETNQDSQPMIQYNFQKEVSIIAALQDAIDHKFISVNDDALNMFKELGWLDDVKAMPTVMMVRAVLDQAFGKEE